MHRKPLFFAARRYVLALGVSAALASSGAGAATALADQPLFTNLAVPGNLALALSVEFPTAVSVAHIGAYSRASTYLGYFDPNKCYLYHYEATEANRHFYPAGAAAARVCTGADDGKWSGNFLNWATMQTIDPFRWALTGGYRVVDTATTTIIEKAWASGQGGTGNFPNRTVNVAADVADTTPFAKAAFKMRIQGLGNKMRFTITGSVDNAPTAWDPAAADIDDGTTYEVSVRVKVCDAAAAAGALEANCKAYDGGNYKPEGLLQKYSDRIRYSAFGYLNDGNILRDGGVLRARQKFIGPMTPVPGGVAAANARREWDAATGVLTLNPEAADAANTAALFGVAVANSGVMNYLNKFGSIGQSYKTYDPVGELYYAAIRYFKNLGNVAAWTAMDGATAATKTTWVDGFPVITNWDDPILWSCQRNFILGIGDVNTHADKNLPGAGTPNTQEPAKPPEVVADNTVDSVAATTKVGVMEGLGAALGTVTPYNGCCNHNSALMAGLAYDANTVDIRPDDATKANTLGKQTIQTYWLDVLEYSTYKNTNQYYLAAKYGGFKVPGNFSPYAAGATIDDASWWTSGEMIGNPLQKRPDNYFVASRPDTMVDGLTKAFAQIAAAMREYTTSFSTSLPQVAEAGNRSYAALFDSEFWVGELAANELAFDAATGAPTQVLRWRFADKLGVQLAGAGWDTKRLVATYSAGAGVPFRLASLTAAQRSALDTPYVGGDDSADYVNYVRGQTVNEVGSADPASTHAYRNRSKLLGDVVGSRVRPVGPPSLILSDSTNPGYAAFKTANAGRPNMVYFGANDGMLHAVNGELAGADAGKEVFAYIPSAVIDGPSATPGVDGLAGRGRPAFVHYNLVNATPHVADVDFGRTAGAPAGTDWRSVLIGGLGKGGRSYYAIDVTNPTAIADEATLASKVLWEFADADLGFTFGEPLIVKTKRWGWTLVFASGYNNADGKGYFYFVNPRTGALLQKLGTGAGSAASPAGLAHVNAFVRDRTDGTIDAVYAGDLLGNLWRVDVTPAGADYAAPTKIAQLTDGAGNGQPVTARPAIEIDPDTYQRWVLVGTGRLLDNTDVASTAAQSFWAIKDGSSTGFLTVDKLPAGVSFPIPRAKMLANADTLNGVSFNQPDQMGWYLDLGAGAGSIGWRDTNDSTVFKGIVAFAATLPSGDACNPSGVSRIYALGIGDGKSRLVSDAPPVGGGPPPVIAYSTAVTGFVTDLRFFSVAGKARLIGGSDNGSLRSIPGNFSEGSTMRRLNWRELPTAD